MSKNTNKNYTQNSLVIGYLKQYNNRYRKNKLTTREITDRINRKYNTDFSTTQISKCLNRFVESKMVKCFPNTNGVGNMWMYKKS